MSLKSFVNKNISAQAKVMAVFTAIFWSVSLVTRYVLFEGWDGVAVLVSGVAATILLWAISSLLKNTPLLIILLFGPFIAVFVEIVHWELISLSFNGQFSWQLELFDARRYAIGVYMWSLFYLVLLLGYFAIFNYFRFMREAELSSEARIHAHNAHLEMLRYQINPHFLFNTLNSVSTLVLDNENDRAEQMIENLSNFLRFSLENTPRAKIPLEDEIAIIKEYLNIEEIRFSEKLTAEFDIDPDTLDVLVPSLILQPAIENTIKHAIALIKNNGKITISSAIVKQKLILCVSDNGPGFDTSQPMNGIGMANMRDRLSAIYGGAANLEITSKIGPSKIGPSKIGPSKIGQGVKVSMTIPVERA